MSTDLDQRNRKLLAMLEYQKNCKKDIPDYNLIGKRVAYFRKERNYSTVDFCARAKISRSMLYKVEHGILTPSITTLIKIFDALDVKSFAFTLPKSKFEDIDQYNWRSGTTDYNIYKLEEELKNFINGKDYFYFYDKKKRALPPQYLSLLLENIEASFAILDLIKHDKDQGDTFKIDDDPTHEDN